jgi:hypothetical protein
MAGHAHNTSILACNFEGDGTIFSGRIFIGLRDPAIKKSHLEIKILSSNRYDLAMSVQRARDAGLFYFHSATPSI